MDSTAKKDKKPVQRAFEMILGFVIGFAIGIAVVIIFKKLALLAVHALYIGTGLHILVHEAGHLAAGLLSGYRFCSFRIFSTVAIMKNGKLVIKKVRVGGTAGQCLMAPAENAGDEIPYRLYNLGGGLANFLLSAVLFVVLIFSSSSNISRAIYLPTIFAGLICGASNLIPLKTYGIPNDGYNVRLLNNSASARHAFRTMLNAHASAANGIRYKDMPAEWFNMQGGYDNAIAGSIAIYSFWRLLDMHEFEQAQAFAELILENSDNMLELHKNELRCELLFMEIIGEHKPEAIEALYTASLQKDIKANIAYNPSRARLHYAYSLLAAKDEAEAAKAEGKFLKTISTYPYEGEIALERELYGIAKAIAGSEQQQP